MSSMRRLPGQGAPADFDSGQPETNPMIILALLRFASARRREWASAAAAALSNLQASAGSRRMTAALASVDRRTLTDIGIGPGEIVSIPRKVSVDRLRRPPHV